MYVTRSLQRTCLWGRYEKGARDEATCKLVTTAGCTFSNGRCEFDGEAMMRGLMMVGYLVKLQGVRLSEIA